MVQVFQMMKIKEDLEKVISINQQALAGKLDLESYDKIWFSLDWHSPFSRRLDGMCHYVSHYLTDEDLCGNDPDFREVYEEKIRKDIEILKNIFELPDDQVEAALEALDEKFKWFPKEFWQKIKAHFGIGVKS